MNKEDMKKWILDQWDKENLVREWTREHIKYNNMKEENDFLIERIDQAREIVSELRQLYDGKDNLIFHDCNELLTILDYGDDEDEEYETYTLTEDEENGTTQINGEWYRVDKK